jgi:hypothetical protein
LTPTAASIIDAHLENVKVTVIENTSVTYLGNSVYRSRFELPSATSEEIHFNFASLLNALRLFVYPSSHTLYGDEYGLRDSKANLTKQLGLMYWDGDNFTKSTAEPFFKPLEGYVKSGSPYSSHHIHERFVGLGHLRHHLRHTNVTYTTDNSIIRYSHDKEYYALIFNKKDSAITDMPFASLIPANLTTNQAYAVHEDGTTNEAPKFRDLSTATLGLKPYEYQIFKFSP